MDEVLLEEKLHNRNCRGGSEGGYEGQGGSFGSVSLSLSLFFVFESAPVGPWQTQEKPFTVQADLRVSQRRANFMGTESEAGRTFKKKKSRVGCFSV